MKKALGRRRAHTPTGQLRIEPASVIAVALVLLGWPAPSGAVPPDVSETATLPVAANREKLGEALSCHGDRCASGGTVGKFSYYWTPSTGWTLLNSSPESVPFSDLAIDLDADEMAHTQNGTKMAVFPWTGAAPSASAFPFFSISGASSVAIDGDWVAVGKSAVLPGEVVLYLKNTGDVHHHEQQTIPLGSAATHRYGEALALDVTAKHLVVGIPGLTTSYYGLVAHYRLIHNTWVLQDAFAAPGAPPGDGFGSAVALSGDWLAVGAPTADTEFTRPPLILTGAVHLYHFDGNSFQHHTTLYGSYQEYAQFGTSVDLSSYALVAGARYEDHASAVDSGAAYVYWRSGDSWRDVARLYASDAFDSDWLGITVALSHRGVLVGASGWDEPGGENLDNNKGALYFFEGLNPLFIDDFESGDTAAWSFTVP